MKTRILASFIIFLLLFGLVLPTTAQQSPLPTPTPRTVERARSTPTATIASPILPTPTPRQHVGTDSTHQATSSEAYRSTNAPPASYDVRRLMCLIASRWWGFDVCRR